MTKLIKKSIVVFAVLLMSGCANTTKPLYAWGQYEALIYQFHNEQDLVEPQAQIEILQRDIAKAQTKNMKVGPGIFAHLGMLYSSVGDVDKAKAALEQEQQLFPEAATFINGLLQRSQSAE